MKLTADAFVQTVEPYSFPEKDDGGKETGRQVEGRWIRVFQRGSVDSFLFSMPEDAAAPADLSEVTLVFEYRKGKEFVSLKLVSINEKAGAVPIGVFAEPAPAFDLPGEKKAAKPAA